ncbi:MAG: DUF998 domain-containing protein [bacterium]
MNKIIKISPLLIIIACIGDFLATFVLGFFYKNYSHLTMVMSELGSSKSPVAIWISVFWVIYGILFGFFGYSFYVVFKDKKSGRIIGLLLIITGIGAGILTGLFPMQAIGSQVTLVGKIHEISAIIGFFAMAFTPVLALNLFKKKSKLRIPLIALQILGLLFFGIFIIAENVLNTNGIFQYIGLWQRLYLAVYYIVFIIFAVILKEKYKNE